MNGHAARGTVTVLVAVFGWALVYFFIATPWALYTTRESTMGTASLLAFEMLRIVPTLSFFLVAGLVIGSLLGSAGGAGWAALGASIAMGIEALIEKQVFYGGIDPLAVAVLTIDYLLPVVFAIVGALITRLWQRRNGSTVAT